MPRSWDDRESAFERHPFIESAKWVFGFLLLAVVVAVVLWAVGVLWSGPKGAGDVHKTNQSALNRIEQQGNFQQEAADFDGYVLKVKTAQQAVVDAKSSKSKFLSQRQVELEGIQQQCIDTAQNYNADSGKILAQDWKDAGLPSRLDPSDCIGS